MTGTWSGVSKQAADKQTTNDKRQTANGPAATATATDTFMKTIALVDFRYKETAMTLRETPVRSTLSQLSDPPFIPHGVNDSDSSPLC